MEDKRTAIAVLLCMFVLMFWMEIVMAPYSRKAATAPAQTVQPQASTQTVLQNGQAAPGQSASGQPLVANSTAKVEVPTPAQIKEAGIVSIETPLYRMQVAKLGARLSSFQLKNYKALLNSHNLLDLVFVNEGVLPLGVVAGPVNDAHVTYSLEKIEGMAAQDNGNYILPKNSTFILHFTGNLTDKIKITKSYTLNADSYLLKLNVNLSSPTPDGSPIWLEWTHFNPNHDNTQRLNHEYFAILGADNKVKLTEPKDILTPVTEGGAAQWISYGDRYFMSSLISSTPNALARIGKEGAVFSSRISGTAQNTEFNVFLGPKSHTYLKESGFQLERNVDLGMFAFIAHPLLAALNFFYQLLGNYGLAIILLTLTIKCLFLPLTKTSFKSMNAMQKLQPEIKALRERIQDPTQLNQEMMGLYKKHGVNPMGGCFPMLIQLPVFLGLYNALNNAIELRHAPFALWINDLSSIERLEVFGIGIPVMVLLMGASMFLQQWTTPSSADPQQKKIMMMMPVIFTASFVIFPFPSGLVLYWLVNNLISIIQQVYLRGDKKHTALQGTLIGSIGIFFVGFVLTLI